MISIHNINLNVFRVNPNITPSPGNLAKSVWKGTSNMTSFAHVDYPTQHPGVVRAENAIAALKNFAAGFDGARGAASLMLAAVCAVAVLNGISTIVVTYDGCGDEGQIHSIVLQGPADHDGKK